MQPDRPFEEMDMAEQAATVLDGEALLAVKVSDAFRRMAEESAGEGFTGDGGSYPLLLCLRDALNPDPALELKFEAETGESWKLFRAYVIALDERRRSSMIEVDMEDFRL